MELTCPNNPKHKKFITTAHVTQDWEVDKNGEYVGVVNECVEVTHRPDKDDVFCCKDCGAEAIRK